MKHKKISAYIIAEGAVIAALYVVLTMVFGSLATLLGAVGTRLLRKRKPTVAIVPPIVANMVIVPLILRYAYGVLLPN